MDLLSLLPQELRAGNHHTCRNGPEPWFVTCAFFNHEDDAPFAPAVLEQGLFGLNLAIAGTATYRDRNGQSHVLRPGSIFQFSVPAGGRCGSIDWRAGCRECCVSFSPAIGAKLIELGIWKESFVYADAEPSATLLQCYLDLYARLQSAPMSYDETLRAIIRIVDLAYAHAQASRPDRRMAEACRMLGEHVEARRCSPREAARALGLSYRTFRLMFTRHAGMPPQAYQQRKLMELACEWLRSGTVKEVSARLGYSNRSVFSKQFKKVIGVSPKAFQRSMGR
jgi:AraC-like DNA-binding protein